MTNSSTALKQALLKEYGSFSDKRIKNIEKGSKFTVDDRSAGGMASDGNPFGWFCTVVAEVVDAYTVRVSLNHSVPQGQTVTAWAAANGIALSDRMLEFSVTPASVGLLTTLAAAFRGIVSPGATRYNVPHYKYACPRTAETLERLARTLTGAWSGG
jgi:hypothetical protein